MIKNIFKITGLVVLVVVAVLAVALAVQWAREAQARAEAERQWTNTVVQCVPELGTTRSLEILPVFEQAVARPDLEPDHGVSYLVRTDHLTILLDVGMTPARWQHNAQVLGLGAADFEAVFITHLHPDHIGGQDAWQANTITLGAPALDLSSKGVYVPLAMTGTGPSAVVASRPFKIAEGVATTGAIAFPELTQFSLRRPIDAEQTLAVNVAGKGIVLIMGCGHPTVERIVARAQAAFAEPIVGIVGGLHYTDQSAEQVQPHLAFVQSLNPQLVALSPHDSGPAALNAFRTAFPSVYREIEVGQPIVFGGRS